MGLSPSKVHCHGNTDADCHPEGCSHCNFRLQPNELYQWAPENCQHKTPGCCCGEIRLCSSCEVYANCQDAPPPPPELIPYITHLVEMGEVIITDEDVTELKNQLAKAGYKTRYESTDREYLILIR